MDRTQQMLFTLQRFQIMTLFTSASSDQGVSRSYAYAWSASVYPLLSANAPWHQVYEPCFELGEAQLQDLQSWLSEHFENGKPLSFFELEEHYGVRGSHRPGPAWSQDGLIRACRYLCLSGEYDREFWSAMLTGSQHPPEAEVILQKFDSDACFFE